MSKGQQLANAIDATHQRALHLEKSQADCVTALKALIAKLDKIPCDHIGTCEETGCIGAEVEAARAVIARVEGGGVV